MTDFESEAEPFIEKFLDRVPEADRDVIESPWMGREFIHAVACLPDLLVQHHIPITTKDEEILRRLLAHIGQPYDIADQVTITNEPA